MRKIGSVSIVASCFVAINAMISAVLILLALGFGSALHRWVPSIEMGTATLTSVLAVAAVTGMAANILSVVMTLSPPHLRADQDTNEDSLSYDQVESLADSVAEKVLGQMNASREFVARRAAGRRVK